MSDVSESLSRALTGAFTVSMPLELDVPHRLIVFSDQHKGGGRGGDDFAGCKQAYVGALEKYREDGFTLVLLGDGEELWEENFERVRDAHRDVLELEGSFPPSRYYRVWGNHDLDWSSERKVRKHLAPFMPGAAVYEGLRFRVTRGGQELGTLFMVHGHQGTVFSDKLAWFSRLFLPIYRIGQGWFGYGKTTPAENTRLRGHHDKEMYEWARSQQHTMLIAGHTHRPVWSSRTHVQKLEYELASAMNEPESEERDERIAALTSELDRRRAESDAHEDDGFRTTPVYFNTGCCRFSDGDITGLELQDGELRLIKWTSRPAVNREVLEAGRLEDIFRMLPTT